MNRIIKTAAIAGLAAIGVIGTATAASASVAVDNGVGFVGKGDVQHALGDINDSAIQSMQTAGNVNFTLGAEKVTADYKMSCYGSDAVGHTIIVQPGTTPVTATPRTTPSGKMTNGWDLTGTAGFTAAGNAFIRTVPCPEGSFMYMNLGQGDLWNTVSATGGLKVNGVDLPNTPIV